MIVLKMILVGLLIIPIKAGRILVLLKIKKGKIKKIKKIVNI